ncbi:MAG: MATE family efflux transporter [Candidatus Muirbacterium halophilum]|nr:MATE family efflux transporter [Candidatus Muirbacterium halophilum]MCK9474283.1 MATE family efflux transporter [Candidatus Muirbacterium halophilum]
MSEKKELLRSIFKIALPTWGAFFTKDLLGIVDMYYVSSLGAESIAAVSLSGIIMGLIFMVGMGINSGTMALVSQSLGARDSESALKTSTQSILLALITGICIAFICIPNSIHILNFVGGEGNVAKLGAQYISILLFGAIFLLIILSLETSMQSHKDSMTPFKSMMTANIVNIILDPILIYGLLGAPALGVAGSAWATLTGQLTGLSVMLYSVFFGKNKKRVFALKYLKPDKSIIKKIWKIGIFSSGKMLVMNLHGIFLMKLVSTFGTVAIAAFGIGLRLRILIFGPSMGFGVAASVLVGHNIGAKLYSNAIKAIKKCVEIIAVIAFVFSVGFFVFAEKILSIFTQDLIVISEGTTFLRWFSISFVFMATGIVMNRAMDGAGYTKIPMWLNIVTLFLIGIPAAYILAATSLGLKGIWISITLSNVILALSLAVDIRRKKWLNSKQ